MRGSSGKVVASRDPSLQGLLDALILAVKFQSAENPAIVKKAINILTKTEKIGRSVDPHQSIDLPALKYFEEAIATAESYSNPISDLALSLADLYDQISWYQSPKGNSLEFLEGHANAQILGPLGIEVRDDVVIGVSLLAPRIQYPKHQHAPEEIYIVLTSGDWYQEGGDWVTPACGGLVYTPPYIQHSIRADSRPLLTIWSLSNSNF